MFYLHFGFLTAGWFGFELRNFWRHVSTFGAGQEKSCSTTVG